MAELLLEIGLEEIPARMIASAEAELSLRVRELLVRERLADGELAVRSYSTPRRLAVLVTGIATAQQDWEEALTGPAWSVAFRDDKPTQAALAFAKKAGVAIEALVKVTTAKGDYVLAIAHRAGRAAADVLTAELAKEIGALAWPKTMYWRPAKPERYVRPVKWLLALLNHAILPIEFAGVRAANLTYGHRILHGEHAVTIDHPSEYVAALEGAKVLADVAVRRHRIRKALDHATRTVTNARWREDEALVESVVQLTEWPSVVLGSFAPEFLALPKEILVTVMRDHQKYFAVEDAQGKLAPHFLAVLNTEADASGIIRHGNERVLRARFSDARFFWEFDQKISLDDRRELLKSVTFHKDLGSYYEKTERTQAIAFALAPLVGAAIDPAALERAILLAKVDLTTELVKEFTELQGIVGGLYARAAGEDERVAAAIYSQYEPASANDPIPPSIEGQVLGLADRIGTIVDMFALGLAPTGSKDPYALRRAANAIVSILAQSGLPLDPSRLIQVAIADAKVKDGERIALTVKAFFRERIEFYMREMRAFTFDVVQAVLAAASDDIADAVARAEALTMVRNSDDFAAISAAFKRSKNLLRQAEEKAIHFSPKIDLQLLQHDSEHALYVATARLGPEVESLRRDLAYAPALTRIATIRPLVDKFFQDVMVMVEEPSLRDNRLALLQFVVNEFSKIADFSEIVPAENS